MVIPPVLAPLHVILLNLDHELNEKKTILFLEETLCESSAGLSSAESKIWWVRILAVYE